MTTDQRERKLDQVKKLLDKASDPSCPVAEQDALRSKADQLMLAYTISEFDVAARRAKGQPDLMPERRHIKVCDPKHPIKTQLTDLMGTVVEHARCKAVYSGLMYPEAGVTATVVGFPSDLDYADMLFTSLYTQMSHGLEPHYDPDLSFEENLVAMKEGGMKWERAHARLQPGVPWERRHGVRYTGIYTRYCEENDRKRMYTSPVTYQRNFAEGFVSSVWVRLKEIRDRRDQGASSTGMDLVLRDKVKDFFEDQFGSVKGVKLGGRSKFDHSASSQGVQAGNRADLGQGRVDSRKELG